MPDDISKPVKIYKRAWIREYFDEEQTSETAGQLMSIGFCWGWQGCARSEEGYFDSIAETERSIDDNIAGGHEEARLQGCYDDSPSLGEPWWASR